MVKELNDFVVQHFKEFDGVKLTFTLRGKVLGDNVLTVIVNDSIVD